jgi:hypothetical protein
MLCLFRYITPFTFEVSCDWVLRRRTWEQVGFQIAECVIRHAPGCPPISKRNLNILRIAHLRSRFSYSLSLIALPARPARYIVPHEEEPGCRRDKVPRRRALLLVVSTRTQVNTRPPARDPERLHSMSRMHRGSRDEDPGGQVNRNPIRGTNCAPLGLPKVEAGATCSYGWAANAGFRPLPE